MSQALSLKILSFPCVVTRGRGCGLGSPEPWFRSAERGHVASTNGAKRAERSTLHPHLREAELFTVITAYPFLSRLAVSPDTVVHVLSNTFPLKSLQAIMFNPFPPLSVHSSDPYDAFRHQILCIILKKKICPVQINPPGDQAVCAEGRPAGKRQ